MMPRPKAAFELVITDGKKDEMDQTGYKVRYFYNGFDLATIFLLTNSSWL
jgi:hypothetical protein